MEHDNCFTMLCHVLHSIEFILREIVEMLKEKAYSCRKASVNKAIKDTNSLDLQ